MWCFTVHHLLQFFILLTSYISVISLSIVQWKKEVYKDGVLKSLLLRWKLNHAKKKYIIMIKCQIFHCIFCFIHKYLIMPSCLNICMQFLTLEFIQTRISEKWRCHEMMEWIIPVITLSDVAWFLPAEIWISEGVRESNLGCEHCQRCYWCYSVFVLAFI